MDIRTVSYLVLLTGFVWGAGLSNSYSQSESVPDKILSRPSKQMPFTSSFLSFLLRDRVADYLDLVEDQRQEIKKIRDHFHNRFDEATSEIDLKEGEYKKILKELNEEMEDQLADVLPPKQKQLYKSYLTYSIVSNQGFVHSLSDGVLATRLDLSDDVRKKIRQSSKQIFAQYEEEIAVAEANAIKKYRDLLPRDAKEEFERILKPMLKDDGSFSANGRTWLNPNTENRVIRFKGNAK